MNIRVICIARNEEKKLEGFFKQFPFDWKRFVLLDSTTTDNTIKVASDLKAKVGVAKFEDFSQMRNEALERFTGDADYVLMMDPDERITKIVDPSKYPNVEVFLANVESTHSKYIHPKQFLFKKGLRFSFKAHEKVLSTKQALYTDVVIKHDRGDKPFNTYQYLMDQERYFTDPLYKTAMDAEYPILFYGHEDDDRIVKVIND